jgi:hypothetical protein
MTLATLVQSQTLATLLQALGTTQPALAGQTVEARLISLSGDGTALAEIVDGKGAVAATLSLVLAGPEAKQAALQPGATLRLRIEAAEEPGAPLRATLVDVRPPGVAQGSQPASQPAASALSPGSQPSVAAAPAAPQRSPLATAQALDPGQAGSRPAGPATTSAAVATSILAAQPHAVSAAPPASEQTPSPRAAAGPLLGPALAHQDGLAPLFANLRGIAQGSVALTVPRPLLQLADQVLAGAIPVERAGPTPQALREAVQRSGLFLEARQAISDAPAAQPDLKASLVALRAALEPLVEALGGARAGRPPQAEAAVAEPDAPARPAAPRRDGPLALQPIAEPTLHAAEKPLALVETLLRQTDAALDRITLAQYASLPPEAGRGEATQSQRWLAEIPLAFQQGAAILPLQIEREPRERSVVGVEAPLWRVRFALDVEPMGPLQGVVTLQGRSVGVTLWAEREETSRLLRGAAPGLEAALLDAQFEQGAIDIHTGQPRVMQATAGQFLDRMS